MVKESIVVVIPVYKPFTDLTVSEQASLVQCFSVLRERTICLFGPKHLDYDGYRQFAEENSIALDIRTFDNRYFEAVKGYNKLLLSEKFYQRFSAWNWILIYQLDAWVFSDQLDFWTREGYDFIGAPLFEGFHAANTTKFVKGLNGGLSFRSLQTSIRLIKRIKKLRGLLFIVRLFSFFTIRSLEPISPLLHLKEKYCIKSFEKLHTAIMVRNVHEDYFFSALLGDAFEDYNVPSSLVASRFSFELNSAYLYELNDSRLPFGCHAWEKYEPVFWRRFIRI